MASPQELEAMRRAIDIAARGLGSTSPNPVVGCVVLDADGAVAGEGWHERAGAPHAEVVALAAAGRRAVGGTAVVTLEPCRHSGRTDPCTDALQQAGIRRVVFAVDDPDPTAAGGAGVLTAAGIDVEAGVLGDDAARGNEAWLHATRSHRPFVTWKYGASLDGRVAAPDGSSRWVTSAESRADAHRLRAECDAVLVGIGTVLTDDPRLTARTESGELAERQPLRVVLDTAGRTPADAAVLDESAPTLVLTGNDLPRAADGLDLHAVLGVLHDRGVVHVLLEGGPTLAMSFVREGLVDRVVGYLAPALIGGGGLPALLGDGAPSIDKAWRLRLDDVQRIGPDVRVIARPVSADGEG